MNVYETKTMETAVKGNSYVGRGIVLGKSKDGKRLSALISSWEEVKTAETESSSMKERM